MDIRYYSDLHLEFMNKIEIQTFVKKLSAYPTQENTVCILAGDIGKPQEPYYDQFFRFIHQHFPKTFVIPGNHEYYTSEKNNTVEKTDAWLKNYFQQYDNITLLNNSFEIYKDHCFIGSVLWTHIFDPLRTINDTNYIPELDVKRYNELNQHCVAFLQQCILSNERCIVITHHMPSEQLIDQKYKNDVLKPYNQWFYCNVEHLFLKDKVKAWVYGHTHTPLRTIINGVSTYCNPNGYPHEDTGFDFEAHFSV